MMASVRMSKGMKSWRLIRAGKAGVGKKKMNGKGRQNLT